MELVLELNNKELDYSCGSRKGDSLDGLIENLSNLGFDKIVISGESKSYTFLRQVALFANMLVKIQNVEVTLKSDSFKVVDGMLFPIYE